MRNSNFAKVFCLFVLFFLITDCATHATSTIDYNAAENVQQHIEGPYKSWYNKVIKGLRQHSIQRSVKTARAQEEYRVVYSVSFRGYDYYSFQVFPDGTGRFRFIVHESQFFRIGRILTNVSKDMSRQETKTLLTVIKDNDFYNIPTRHPAENPGEDGSSVFVEGYNNSTIHYIEMWMPGEEYPIEKIHRAFADFADTIATRPTS